MRRRSKSPRDEAVRYAEDILVEALRTGYADPILLVECVHYAAEPELVGFTRAFAALEERSRAEVMRTVQALSGEPERSGLSHRLAH
ncbi:MAG TPA: hypothetical protein VHG30_01590 [Microvirga sp.]|jgi:hypothetical protein|nr:hypothetical protein [Microvirga sp.]